MKVTVCGCAGGIGMPLSLLLKICPLFDEVSLYDVVNSKGVGADLSHINTAAKVSSFTPQDDGLDKALNGADFVVIPAGVPRKPGMTRDDLFSVNAGIVASLAEGVARNCPNSFVLLISNPVNSTVAVFAEVMKKQGKFNGAKLFGVTSLDGVRAATFLSEFCGKNVDDIDVTVIGGHSGNTIVPLFSIADKQVYSGMTVAQRDALINRVQYGGDEVVSAKEGKGSATLSMAYAAFTMVEKLARAVADDSVTEVVGYVSLDSGVEGAAELKSRVNDVGYFAAPLVVGKNGIQRVEYEVLDQISEHEKELLISCLDQLESNVDKGRSFVIG